MSGGWRRFLPYARPHVAPITGVLVLVLVGIGFELMRPWPMQLLVDYVLPGRPVPWISAWVPGVTTDASRPVLAAWLSMATVLLFLVIQLASLIRAHVQAGIGTRMSYALGADLFAHFQSLSGTFHASRQVGDLTRRIVTDATCVRDLLVAVAIPGAAAVVRVIAMVVVMWHMNPFLALCAIAVAPITLVLIRRFEKPMTRHTYEQQQIEGEVMAHAEQTLTALPIVKAFGREAHHDSSFQALSERSVNAAMRATRSQLVFKTSVGAVSAVGTAMLMLLGGLLAARGDLTSGELLVFLAYLAALYAPMEILAYSSAGYAAAAARAQRVLEVLDAPEFVAERPGATALSARVRGAIAIEGATFGYEPGRPVLDDITLTIAPGEVVAIVGPTGSGKSTLVGLVPRFFDPWRGRVTLDGQDVRELTLASVRAQVALVLQEPFLLPVSIAENIAYGRPDAAMAQIEAAARAANAHEFITRLPKGYATVLAERGGSLSGGERQRLAIARALLKDAPILILDEPTSALDTGTEALLLDALERLMQGRTTLIIAHRLTTVRRADRIVVVSGGRLVEQGTHAELLAQQGTYATLYRSQFRARFLECDAVTTSILEKR